MSLNSEFLISTIQKDFKPFGTFVKKFLPIPSVILIWTMEWMPAGLLSQATGRSSSEERNPFGTGQVKNVVLTKKACSSKNILTVAEKVF